MQTISSSMIQGKTASKPTAPHGRLLETPTGRGVSGQKFLGEGKGQ